MVPIRNLLVFLFFALIVASFAIQNHQNLSIHFLLWTFPKTPLSLIVIVSLLFGALLGVLLALKEARKKRRASVPQPEQTTPAPSPESNAKND